MDREFRLAPAGSGRGISCDANGAFVGSVPLLKRSRMNGKDAWQPRDCGQLSEQIGAEFGIPVDLSPKMGGLDAISRALNEDDVARAQIVTLLLAIPDPPPFSEGIPSSDGMIKLVQTLQSSGMIKADWNPDDHPRWPAGAPDSQGGQFAPQGKDGNDEDSEGEAEVTSESEGARLEYAAYTPSPNDSMKTSASGQNFIKENEGGFRPQLYDASPPKGDWTIGYGHAVRGAEHDIYDNATLNEGEGEELFQSDLAVAENAVRRSVQFPLNQNQFDALVDFAFNIGVHGFSASYTLSLLNSASDFTSYRFGDLLYAEGIWAQAFGNPNRRKKEITRYNTPVSSEDGGI